MSRYENIGLASAIIYLIIVLGALSGWIVNIIKVFETVNLPVSGIFIMRCVGIPFAPLGAFLGWF